ncbi:MAG: response regulator [Nitrososphaerales archaeon]
MTAKHKHLLILQFAEREDHPSTVRKVGEKSESPKTQKNIPLSRTEGKRQVAIVDDDPLIRTIFSKVLRMNGLEVVAAVADGADIVELIESSKPNIILLDERMPRMSGVEACKIIHAKYPDIAVIFVSADQSVEQRALNAGAKAFLKKPVSSEKLIALVNSF